MKTLCLIPIAGFYSLFLWLGFFSASQGQTIQLPPEWYNEARVQVHTRYPPFRFLGRNQVKEKQFFDFQAQMQRLGIRVCTRWVQSRDGLSIYPLPQQGEALPEVSKYGDIAQRLFSDARKRKQTIIGYYNHFLDTWAAKAHPEWIALDRDGKEQGRKLRGTDVFVPWMSLANKNYQQHVIGRLLELQKRGMQGVYFDMTHVPPSADYSLEAQKLYQQLTGKRLLEASEDESLAFRQEIMRLFFTQVNQFLKAQDPDYLILISHNKLSLDVLRESGGVVKSEPHFNQKLGGLPSTITLLMDVGSAGGAPHFWRRNFDPIDPPRVFAQYYAYGAVLNMDFLEGTEAQIPMQARPELEPLLNLGKKMSPAMKHAAPLRFARVLVNGNLRLGENEAQAKKSFAAFQELNQAQIPCGYLSYSQLENELINPYCQVLLIPDYTKQNFAKSHPQAYQKALTFAQAGGKVLYAEGLRGQWVEGIRQECPIKLQSANGKTNQDVVVFFDTRDQSLIVQIVAPPKQQLSMTINHDWVVKQGLNIQATLPEQITQQEILIKKQNQTWQLQLPEANKGVFLRQMIIPSK